MPTSDEYFDADMGIVFVQPGGPNTPVYPIPCYNLDSVDEPWGETATRLCKQGDGTYAVIHRAQGLPGEATYTVETNLPKSRDLLQKAARRRCPFPMYISKGHCGRPDTLLGYEYIEVMADSLITSRGKGGLIRGTVEAGAGAADQTTMSFDLSANPMPEEVWKLVMSRHTIAEDQALRDVDMLDTLRCGGVCGSLLDPCTYGVVAANSAALSPPDVWETENGWDSGAALAAPFGAVNAEDVASACHFEKDAETIRYIVGRGTASVVPAAAEIAYNDYNITTDTWSGWTQVNLPTANGDYLAHGGGLFALDWRHVWACTNDGLVCFSEDGGETWVDQGAPTPTPAEPLMCIRFADHKYGMCVGGTGGASSVLLTTTDGGDHWTLVAAATLPSELLTGVAVIDNRRAWVCTADGELWYTNNFGAIWVQRNLPTPVPTALGDVCFKDVYAGFVCGYKTLGMDFFPVIYRTFNGGMDWEVYAHDVAFSTEPTLYGLNALHVCDYNRCFAVGEVLTGSLSCVLELSPAGSA